MKKKVMKINIYSLNKKIHESQDDVLFILNNFDVIYDLIFENSIGRCNYFERTLYYLYNNSIYSKFTDYFSKKTFQYKVRCFGDYKINNTEYFLADLINTIYKDENLENETSRYIISNIILPYRSNKSLLNIIKEVYINKIRPTEDEKCFFFAFLNSKFD